MNWVLRVSKKALKDLRRLPKSDLRRIDAAFEAMAADPYGGDTKKLGGSASEFRRRVGVWRVFFAVDGKTVFVLRVMRRTTTTYRV